MNRKYSIVIPSGAKRIIDTLSAEGHQAYIVGGCVRDSLIGLEPKDWDICTSATPNVTKKCLSGYRIIETGLKHGTVTVVCDDGQYEVTTFRIDGNYSDNRRPDSVQFVDDINVDLSRRDFTMNAIAYNEELGLIDPFNGVENIQDRRISCVGNPNDRFKEDGLRILRALRFSAVYGFDIDYYTALSIHKNVELLKNISVERINAELCKILSGEHVLKILLDYPDVITYIIPELKRCVGFNQNNRYHKYDVYEHTAHAVSNYIGNDVCVNVALLLHDSGKPGCYSENETGGHFYQHGYLSAKISESVVKRLRFDKQSQRDIIELVMFHDAVMEPNIKTARKWLNKVGEQQLRRLLDIRMADILAQSEYTLDERIERRNKMLEFVNKAIEERQCFSLRDLAINGHDIISLGLNEGEEVGEALNYALNAVIEGSVENEKRKLIELIKSQFDFRKQVNKQ